jgi:hypothetical protein
MNKRLAFYIVSAVILVLGLFLIIPNPVVGPKDNTTQSSTISYQGVEGKNALELLRVSHDVETQKFDFGELVTSIDGQASDPSANFWAFYVNGEMAQVGAGDYQTKSSDRIEWKLDSLN